MHKAKTDLPVLLIFFARPDALKETFAAIKEARPSKLFLACDGPRNDRDKEKIEECKKIVEDIDWECEVYKRYSDINQGCGRGPSNAISWALEKEDRVVILEDDCVPNLAFFGYMKELLEKYKDDTRIGMISGLNHFKDWECGGNSYCFTRTGAIWGWGTWRRVWKDYDYSVSKIQDEYVEKLVANDILHTRYRKYRISTWNNTRNAVNQNKKISYWDHQFGFLKYSLSYLTIVPKHNLICNIGVGESSTHANFSTDNVWKKGKLHFIPTKEIELPLRHPDIIVCDREYDENVVKTWFAPNPIVRNFGRAKRLIKKILKVY